MFWTVYFDTDEMPQDFDSYEKAQEYAEEIISQGRANSYLIETPC